MALFEFAKAALRLFEYRTLAQKENIKLFIDQAEYHEHKESLEVKRTHYKLPMQNRQAPRIQNYKLNPKL